VSAEQAAHYHQVLKTYLEQRDEASLARAGTLGRELLHSGVPPEDIVEMHSITMHRLVEQGVGVQTHGLPACTCQPLVELMMAYSMAFREQAEFLRAEEDMLLASEVVENTQQGVILTNAETVILKVNAAFCDVTGYTEKEVIGQTPRMLHSGRQDEAFYRDMWQHLEQDGRWQGKIWNRRKNGKMYHEQLTIKAVPGKNGHTSHYVGIFTDISEQTELEEKFRQAQKMNAVGVMVGGIAHNFNNMLAGMTGYLYLAKQEAQSLPKVVQKLSNIEEISQRAAEMIKQLLAFARKDMVHIQPMPFTPFLKETLKLLRTSLPENIALHEHICNEELCITGSATQLHQVLANLFNNARDALEDVTEPSVNITLEAFRPDNVFMEAHPYIVAGAYAHLCVADNGCGIPAHQLEHLFEPFYTTKEQGKGTGLGLSMVFGAIKMHHGFVEVDSVEKEGTSFHLYLPLLSENEDASPPSAAQEQTADADMGHGELLMLADDESMVREVMVEILESMGYRVLQAKDGREAAEVFAAHCEEIALVLLDVVMPHDGGVPLAERLRKINPDVPVIFMTGYDQSHVLAGNKPIPNSEVLSKPVSFNVLRQSIRKQLDG